MGERTALPRRLQPARQGPVAAVAPCHLPPLRAGRRRGEAAQRGGEEPLGLLGNTPAYPAVLPGLPPFEARKGLPQTTPPQSQRPVEGAFGRQRCGAAPGVRPGKIASPGPRDPRCPNFGVGGLG